MSPPSSFRPLPAARNVSNLIVCIFVTLFQKSFFALHFKFFCKRLNGAIDNTHAVSCEWIAPALLLMHDFESWKFCSHIHIYTRACSRMSLCVFCCSCRTVAYILCQRHVYVYEWVLAVRPYDSWQFHIVVACVVSSCVSVCACAILATTIDILTTRLSEHVPCACARVYLSVCVRVIVCLMNHSVRASTQHNCG